MDENELRDIIKLKGVIAAWREGDVIVVLAEKTLSPRTLSKLKKKHPKIEVFYGAPITVQR